MKLILTIKITTTMVEASQLLLSKIDKLVQSKSNNKFDYDNIRKISFTVDCIIVYLSSFTLQRYNYFLNCTLCIAFF